MSIRTILFDLDGTLIDTNELIIASFRHTLDQFSDRTYSREEILSFIGPPLRDSLQRVDPDKVEEMVKVYREHNHAHHAHYVKAYEGVVETIQYLKAKGYQLGIVTTKMRQSVHMGLELTGLDGLFDVIIALDDVVHAKPDPEPIEKAMDALHANAYETMMVGDNTHDIEAGQRAGVKTVGVAWTVKGRNVLDELNPDYMLEQMSQIIDVIEG
ncbi:pyrophosphatase PpaX [Thalassobacillus sp. CUG 92003]|uniref:pyrophosphatase PpaX n=1 Tax=Thalassobacillus sp. CUG 92003 TaxID=2736641 RepID=UPI0015E78756|nr:pyrophosphatase PpaX [Thalassobacillus sp. CUG 92003]